MPTELTTLTELLSQTLQPELFQDYCPNGLQVEGKARVSKLVSGVTASQQLIDRAIAAGADAILVHHGYFWKGEQPCITGMKKQRLSRLLQHDISLLAYHLPLDTHPRLGNNVQLANQLGIKVTATLDDSICQGLGNIGELAQPVTLTEWGVQIAERLGRQPLLIAGGDHPVTTVAWCTGAAQAMIEQAADAGVDAFLSGEISEPTVHVARERGLHYIAAGHHATERFGVQALGRFVADRLGIEHLFIDCDNPA